ncbi:hypothetical protein NUM3379_15230 [Kineococcus sp. NUM-3379]
MSRSAVPDELSRLDVAAAEAAAGVLTGTAITGDLVSGTYAAARASTPQWRGDALAGYAQACGEVERRLDLLTYAARAGATVLAEYSRGLAQRQARLRRIAHAAADVELRMQRVDALGTLAADTAEADRLLGERQSVVAEQDRAVVDVARRLDALIDDVDGRPRSWGEHVSDGVGAFVREGIAEPAAALAFLTVGWASDRAGWWRAVRSLPGAQVESARHPVRTTSESLKVEEFRSGRTGEAVGSLAAAMASRRLGKVVPRPRRPVPVPVSFDEMLAGVDLTAMEGVGDAHTLSRHVDVDDGYLRDRLLRSAEAADRDPRAYRMTAASRWADQETAEREITQALRDNEAAIRSLIAGGITAIEVTEPARASSGRVITLHDGRFATPDPVQTVVQLNVRDGKVTVHTAYLKEK